MLVRAIEYDVLPTCLRHGMGVLSYSQVTGAHTVNIADNMWRTPAMDSASRRR